jgi:hypothetical protein
MTTSKAAFSESIASTFSLMGIGVPAQVTIIDPRCDTYDFGRGRILQDGGSGGGGSFELEVNIKSDTKEAIDKITKAADDPAGFATAYSTAVVEVRAQYPQYASPPPMDPGKIRCFTNKLVNYFSVRT